MSTHTRHSQSNNCAAITTNAITKKKNETHTRCTFKTVLNHKMAKVGKMWVAVIIERRLRVCHEQLKKKVIIIKTLEQ